MNLKKSVWLVAVLLGMLMWAPLSAQAGAVTFTWDGSSSALWDTAANWDKNNLYPGQNAGDEQCCPVEITYDSK